MGTMGQGMAGNQTGMPITNQPTQQNQMNPMERMIFEKLYQTNPKFREFANSVKNMSPEQAFRDRGLDYNQYRNIGPDQIMKSMGM